MLFPFPSVENYWSIGLPSEKIDNWSILASPIKKLQLFCLTRKKSQPSPPPLYYAFIISNILSPTLILHCSLLSPPPVIPLKSENHRPN
jgi:hypothetical protein